MPTLISPEAITETGASMRLLQVMPIGVCLLAVAALPVEIRAAHTSSIVFGPNEKTVCAVNQDSGSISLWDFAGDGSVVEIKAGDEPRTLAVSPDGKRIYVANQSSQTLSIVDVDAGKAVVDVELGGQPYGVVLDGRGRRAFVSQYAGGYIDGKYHRGTVAVVGLPAGKLTHRIPVRARPWAMALAPDGRSLYVTHYLALGGEGIVTEIDLERLAVRRVIAMKEDDSVFDGRGGVFNALAAIALHPNGNRALVAGMHANVRRGASLSGKPLSHKTMVQAVVRVIDLEAGQELFDARLLSSFSGQAVAVPSAVAFLGSGEHFIDLYLASVDFKVIKYNERGVVAERAMRAVPAGPTGLAVTRDGKTAVINCRFDRSVAQFSLADVRDPVLVRTVRMTEEPWDQRRLRGAILFHNTRDTRMTANRWISCSVCHLEGGQVSDGAIWDLTVDGGQPKTSNTMDLVNTRGTGPPFFHRGTPTLVGSLQEFVEIFHAGSGFPLEGSRADFRPTTLRGGMLGPWGPRTPFPVVAVEISPQWADT
ncbi:MAG: beta-propeller fold lactonase family protein, partial [Planctomycetota bacterium]